jgi:hypothetical protein
MITKNNNHYGIEGVCLTKFLGIPIHNSAMIYNNKQNCEANKNNTKQQISKAKAQKMEWNGWMKTFFGGTCLDGTR